MKKMILFGGIYNILLALFHCGFWKIWSWDTELEKLSFTNKWVMQILNVQIIYYFIFTAVICFVFPKELLTTKLGKCFLVGSAGFWFVRAVQQFAFWELGAVPAIIWTSFFLLGAVLFLVPAVYCCRHSFSDFP